MTVGDSAHRAIRNISHQPVDSLVIAEYPLSPPVGPMLTVKLLTPWMRLLGHGLILGVGAGMGLIWAQSFVPPLRRSMAMASVMRR